MSFQAKVIEDSMSLHGVRLCTLQLRYPRFIHAEFMTHRVFSRNASSSRAIPVAKMIEQVRNEPAMPIHWGKNQPGMQAHEELEGLDLKRVQQLWEYAAYQAAETAQKMADIGVHKQVVNRILEPFQWISVVVTATEWDNFFALRDHEDAQPEIRHLARLMRAAMDASTPVQRGVEPGFTGNWHLPYVSEEERVLHRMDPWLLAKISAARCARVSYLNHDQSAPSIEKDFQLYERLVGSEPLHASPVEHQAFPMDSRPELAGAFYWTKNFRDWNQYRIYVEGAELPAGA